MPLERCENDFALSVRGLDVDYDGVQVLFEVDLEVAPGQIVALLGTNGAGKSTLLNAVAGLHRPMHGSVWLQGRNITGVRAEEVVRLGCVLVPGGRANFPSLTVSESLRTAAWTLRRDRAALARALDRAYEVFPVLEERAEQRAGTLSGGEQQMLALARAFVLRPQLLLVDELTLGLAPTLASGLVDALRDFTADGGSVLLVEQSVKLALSVADRAYFMERGRIRFEGPASELVGRKDLLRAVFLDGAGR